MNSRDFLLGMDRAISRRDFLNGVGVAVGTSLLPGCAKTGESDAVATAAYYPPAETGMRGSHAGSFEAAHATVRGQRWVAEKTPEHYDLVVVGAGISGLSAAYIYRRDIDPDARILILDNHDDFGGHAKRNEFTIDGRTLVGFGGTMTMTAPNTYPDVAKQVVRELGIDPDRYDEFHHKELFASLDIGRGIFFDKENFGADHLAVLKNGLNEAMSDAPLSESTRVELERLFADEEDYLVGMTPAERRAVLESHSWREYLKKFAGMGEEALLYVQKMPHGNWSIGADAYPAWLAWTDAYPGFAGMDLGYDEEEGGEEGGQVGGGSFHFPDGNASIARSLVRKMIPDVAPGNSMEDIVTANFDYSRLDQAEIATRIRLNSTVVELHHRDGKLDADIDVTYVSESDAHTVTASKVVWAGYHAMLPHVCPDVPEEQAAAQGTSVRSPLVYTNVSIRNWRSFVNLGISRAYCPGSFFQSIRVNRPVSIGDYHYPQSPDEPMVLHLQHMPLAPGLPAHEQFRAGRRALYETPFEVFERHVRDQLGRILGPGGFDPARDIAGITVNRWPHGYAYSVDSESGEVAWWPERWPEDRRPWVEARQRVGNISIAGTDAASNAMTEAAIEEAHRAVHSLIE
jgi:spermidine dehydrogenase